MITKARCAGGATHQKRALATGVAGLSHPLGMRSIEFYGAKMIRCFAPDADRGDRLTSCNAT